MAKRRDFIEDILERQNRHAKRTDRWGQLMKRIEGLLWGLNHTGRKAPKKNGCQAELLRYFPIGIVAASEGYFRLVYRDLINFGDPFLRNAANFKDLRLGHEAIYAIHGRRTTVGEIIAHQLPHNGLADITRNMDALTGGDLMAAVCHELENATAQIVEISWVPKFVVRTFELRHIFCHELATSFSIQAEEINRCVTATLGFLYCSEGYVQGLLGEERSRD
jgi:hypothetical protein